MAAFACGLFEGKHAAELRARLTGTDDDNFRSAMSECLAAWYLAGRLRLRVEPRPEGRSGRALEFAIKLDDGYINVEVKAPHRPFECEWLGDDSDRLQKALGQANKQFASGKRNLLILVPCLHLMPIFDIGRRGPIERAFIGETVIRIPIDRRTGGPAGPERLVFKESGTFARPDRKKGAPRHTRIGAALFLEERVDGSEVTHRALMVHNPNAEIPLPREPWANIPEFFCDRGCWRWSDVGTE